MKTNILFVGPFCTGKSSVSYELSLLLDYPLYPIDRIKWYFLFKNGFSFNKAEKILDRLGLTGVIQYYTECFSLKDLKQIVKEFPSSIIEIPPYNIYSDDPCSQYDILNFLKDFKHVFLLLPSTNIEKSIDILNKRLYQRKQEKKIDFASEIDEYILKNIYFLTHPLNTQFPFKVIYTENLTPKEIAFNIKQIYF